MRIIIMVHLYHKKLSSFHETLSLRAGGLLLLLVTGEGRSGEGREAMATRILFTVAAGPITPCCGGATAGGHIVSISLLTRLSRSEKLP